jgi:hypothetical protein
MLSKCANPPCPTEFKYFRHGRLFEFNLDSEGRYNTLPPQRGTSRELFWLCHDCARKLTLQCDTQGRVEVAPRAAKEQHVA